MSIVNKKVLKYTVISGDFNTVGYANKEAFKTILSADVIIYDEYINPEIVIYLKHSDILLHKTVLNEKYDERTEALNKLIVELTHTHGHVVHLRGLNHKLFNQSFSSVNYAKLYNIEADMINLNIALPQELFN